MDISSKGIIYSEESFCSLVRSESKRSERSGYLCRILLIYRINKQGVAESLGDELTAKTLSILASGSRDTDYIGWYRQDRIIGTLLTMLRQDSVIKGGTSLETRLVDRLCGAFVSMADRSLQLRMLDLGELTTFRVPDHPVSRM